MVKGLVKRETEDKQQHHVQMLVGSERKVGLSLIKWELLVQLPCIHLTTAAISIGGCKDKQQVHTSKHFLLTSYQLGSSNRALLQWQLRNDIIRINLLREWTFQGILLT